MNIDELEKLARAAHDPGFPWVDRDAIIGGLFAKGEIDYIAAASPAAILELISINRELVACLENITEIAERVDGWESFPYRPIELSRNALDRANGESNE